MSDDLQHDLEEQEREEILEEIDKLVATNRLPAADAAGKLKAQKSGAAFPLVINIIAVAAVLSTFYFSNRLFEQRQETLSIENATYQSAEGKLLEELKRESDEKLRLKEQEITAINDELAELDRQSRELVQSMDQQIADREAILREALEAELEEERKKLRAAGKSETDIEEELSRIEQQRTAEYEAELASFRAETERQIAEKEEELARARELNEELLAEVNSEKQRIQNETRQREAELTAQYEAEKAALAEEAAAAEAQLEQLTEARERESLIIDQLNSTYESIFNLLESGNTDAALAQVEALQNLITDPSVASLSSVRERSANDRSMIELIRQRVEEQSYKEDVDTRSLTEAADLLLSAQEIAGLGTEAFRAGNQLEAADYYTRSLEKIPALRQAWQNLEAITGSNENERLSSLLQQGRNLEENGRHSEAAQKYAEAAIAAETYNPELLNRAVSSILGSTKTAEEAALSDKDTAFSKLKSESTSEIAALKDQLEDNKQSFSLQLTETETQWENRLTAAEDDYESKLLDAGTSRSALETEKNEEIDRLTRLIGERDQENLRLNSEKEETEAALADARQTITDGEAYIAGLQAEAEAESEQLKADLDSASSEIERLKTEIDEAKEAALADSDEKVAELNSMLAEANSELEQLKTDLAGAEGLEAELAEAKTAYSDLQDKYSLEQESTASRLRAIEMTGYNNGLNQGRSDAMQDILEFASYLDGSVKMDSEARTKVAELSSSDPGYQQAIRKIQEIAETGAETAAAEAVAGPQSILIGSISYASGTQVIIEPLSDIELETGTRITIMRRERGKAETYVTFGVVTSVSEDRITARTDPAGTEQARSMDIVYILR